MKSFTDWGKFDQANQRDIVDFYNAIWHNQEFEKVNSVAVHSYERLPISRASGQPGTLTTIKFATYKKGESGYGTWWTMTAERWHGCASFNYERVMNPLEVDLEAYYA